ncbi:hypothetical protein Ocin01_09586 [Orchesella cincta]|uniref:Uncharacterized protein n=1 Tax=Orchesella cincta TaxID=48709 RepID=A0A1D2MVW6_ORCCI|nr:hypothetical protein Ocin01_09586 [Orchesella cincta]
MRNAYSSTKSRLVLLTRNFGNSWSKMAQNLWKWDSDSESEGNDAKPNDKSSEIKTSAQPKLATSVPMNTGRFQVVAVPRSTCRGCYFATTTKYVNAHVKSIEKIQAQVEKLGVGDAENETSTTNVSDSVEGRASTGKRVSRLPPPPSNLMDDSEEELIFEFDNNSFFGSKPLNSP